ncbi:unnamed protein product [Caenorhabditis bovis]|uniref:Glycosyltransferase family 92 protein n=1 Tax=Caenorhabditis bovis TaxID=2654633 RepID=A0A8S1F2Q9_9PELO|nr:unnamed protein product [Caenorhabditis bovis]
MLLYIVTWEQLATVEDVTVFISAPYDIFFFSAYFFNHSKSLGDSAFALLVTADFEVLDQVENFELIAVNSTHRIPQSAKLERITPHDSCKWIAILAKTQLVPNLSQVFISLGGKHAQIPFEVAPVANKPVVICISPLFAAENWPNILVALHVYKKFNAHLHMSIRSVISPILEILKVYEKHGYVTIQSWPKIRLLNHEPDDFNANLNVEFRSQAASQTDCLLRYKESAEFIAFLDLDDLLIPRLASNFLMEFRSFVNVMSDVAFLQYNKENTQSIANQKANVFSVSRMLRSIKFTQKNETGKIVALPAKMNSTWIHWSNDNLKIFHVPREMNAITHLKDVKMVTKIEEDEEEMPTFGDGNEPLMSEKSIREIEEDYRQMSWKPEVRKHLHRLPRGFALSKLIGKCYQETYYKFHARDDNANLRCPGPERCNLTSYKTNCWNSIAEYHSTRDGRLINIHFLENQDFRLSKDGCIV